MSKLLFLLISFSIYLQVNAQFILPTNTLTEVLYPSLVMPMSSSSARMGHSSCFTYNNNGEEYDVWAWNSGDFISYNRYPQTSVAWRKTNSSGSIQGTFIPFMGLGYGPEIHLAELEVAIYARNNDVYIVVATYLTENFLNRIGHFYQIWKWDNVSNSFTLQHTEQLSTEPRYTRISIDGYQGEKIAFTWEEGGGVVVRTGVVNPTTGNLDLGNKIFIRNSSGATLPDIAFAQVNSDLLVRVVYLFSNSELEVCHLGFNTLQTTTASGLPFVFDDSWGTTYNYPLYIDNYKTDLTMTYFQLDCPTQESGITDHIWTVIYNDNQSDITARIKPDGTSPTSVVLSSIFPSISPSDQNIYPTLVYATPAKMYFGWVYAPHTNNPQYLGLYTDDNGNPNSNDYLLISDVNPPIQYSPGPPYGQSPWLDMLSFAKSPETDEYIFATYATMGNSTVDIVTKTVLRGSPTFKPSNITEANNKIVVTLYPNPSTSHFNLRSDNPDIIHDVTIYGMLGNIIFHQSATVDVLNAGLTTFSKRMLPGVYAVRIKRTDGSKALTVVKQ